MESYGFENLNFSTLKVLGTQYVSFETGRMTKENSISSLECAGYIPSPKASSIYVLNTCALR